MIMTLMGYNIQIIITYNLYINFMYMYNLVKSLIVLCETANCNLEKSFCWNRYIL